MVFLYNVSGVKIKSYTGKPIENKFSGFFMVLNSDD